MRALLLTIALLLAAPAARACEDVLIGDSIAVGMGEAAALDGFRVVAVGGVRLSWAEEQARPPCVRHMVLVIGTNDLRSFRGADEALDYVRRVEALIQAWRPMRAVWVSPSCFDPGRNPTLNRGSEILHPAVLKFRPRPGWFLVDGWEDGCPSLTRGDGVHPDAETANAWWRRAHRRLVAGGAEASSSAYPPRAFAALPAVLRAPPAMRPGRGEALRGHDQGQRHGRPGPGTSGLRRGRDASALHASARAAGQRAAGYRDTGHRDTGYRDTERRRMDRRIVDQRVVERRGGDRRAMDGQATERAADRRSSARADARRPGPSRAERAEPARGNRQATRDTRRQGGPDPRVTTAGRLVR